LTGLRKTSPLCDVKARGLLEAIILFEGKILDGRHRHAACIRHDVAPRFIEFTGTPEEALDLVIGRNLLRRHLSVSQRAIWAAKLVNTRQGERIDLLAAKMGVSEESVRRARKILESAKRSDGGKAILSFVQRGEVTVKAGAKVIDGDRADETVSDDRTGDVDKIKDLASFKKVQREQQARVKQQTYPRAPQSKEFLDLFIGHTRPLIDALLNKKQLQVAFDYLSPTEIEELRKGLVELVSAAQGGLAISAAGKEGRQPFKVVGGTGMATGRPEGKNDHTPDDPPAT